ncbi:ABC transporter permease [Achromatium sp. WMS2]|nr:ABC transporter permease [Achromatium sp. WMS2]
MNYSTLSAVYQRELAGYFNTPIAYVFIIIFVVLAGLFTFYLGDFFGRNQADLQTFFQWHPWLYLFLVPALAMRMWAEERRSGTLELLLSLPITVVEATLAKFLAAWTFTAISLALTTPIWLTVNFLGSPDNGAILAGFLGSLLMAGGYLAIGSCMSALTRNQVIAFVLSAVASLLFVLSGFPLVLDIFGTWAPSSLVQVVASFSFLTHFDAISKGVIDLRDLTYFLTLITFWLFATVVIIEMKKAD